MARSRITTVRLDAADQRALARAKRDGIGASELIRRGLRAVASRYYPEADASGRGADPETPAMRAWRAERAAFERMSTAQTAPHRGKWVAVLDGRIVLSDRNVDSLSRRMRKRAKARAFYVVRVGADLEIVDMPGFEIEKPIE